MPQISSPHSPQTKRSDLAIASMICGVLSLAGFGLFLGIPAIILAAISLKKHRAGRNYSIAGLITGIISTLLSLALIALIIFLAMMDGLHYRNPGNGAPAEPVAPPYESLQT